MTATTAAPAPTAAGVAAPGSPWKAFGALAIDAGLPLAAYFVAKDVVGLSLVGALIAGSVPPVLTSLVSWARQRTISSVSALMLFVNLAGIAVSFVGGGARLLFAKDSAVSSVLGIVVLVSAVRGRPVMSEALRPFVTRGNAGRDAAWVRLSQTSTEFRRYERRYSLVWGSALMADCAARIVCAFVMPLSTLGWLGTAIVAAAITLGVVVSGGTAFDPIQKLVEADTEPRRLD